MHIADPRKSNDFVMEICKKNGIDPRLLRHAEIHFPRDGVVELVVTLLLSREAFEFMLGKSQEDAPNDPQP